MNIPAFMLEDSAMILNRIAINSLLSFSPSSPSIELGPLNILIGPNGAGKSNIIEAISLLRASPTKLNAPMRGSGGGGIAEWIWKGEGNKTAKLEVIVENPSGNQPLRHTLEFEENASRFEIVDEKIENEKAYEGHTRTYFYYRFQHGRPVLAIRDGNQRYLSREDVSLDESILSQRKDPDQYPELAYLSRAYTGFRLYRDWSFGRTSVFRKPQPADMPSDRLEEDFSNLGLFLNHLRSIPTAKNQIVDHLQDLYEGLEDFDVRIKGGTVEVFLTEGSFIIPASRLSDGTLRYLTLLAILCDPDPPSLICIEEPELGLHPDMLPKIADLLVEASGRAQLIVTTHSDILVDAMTERPEAIVIVEKQEGSTIARRLDKDRLETWLKSYRLGELWTRGDLGGTRF